MFGKVLKTLSAAAMLAIGLSGGVSVAQSQWNYGFVNNDAQATYPGTVNIPRLGTVNCVAAVSGVLQPGTCSATAVPSGPAGGALSGTYPNPTVTLLSIDSSAFQSVWLGSVPSPVLNTGWAYLTAVGVDSLTHNTTGYSNTAVGRQAMQSVTTGYENTAIGAAALKANTIGVSNTAVGEAAVSAAISANNNTGVGWGALYQATSSNNTAVGQAAALALTTGANNTIVGQGVLTATVGGDQNTAVGALALTTNVSGSYNTAVGYEAGYGGTGSQNSLYGYTAGYGLTTGFENMLLTFCSIVACQNQVTSGANNVAIGNNVAVVSATASNQWNLGNFLYCSGVTGTGATISTGALCGILNNNPTVAWDVNGAIKTAVYAVASLPTCNAGNEGARAGVNNATVSTFASVPIAGGAVHVPVYCNGTSWIIG